MKNLALQRLVSSEYPNEDEEKFDRMFCVVDQEEGSYVYLLNSGTIYKINTCKNEIEQEFIIEPANTNSGFLRVLSLTFIALKNSIFVATNDGRVLSIKNDYEIENEVEKVGEVSCGLLAMEWSPDEELVVFVSAENKAIVMTSGFDPISEVDIHQEEFGIKASITVGWGKKETQFHGSEGKAAARAGGINVEAAIVNSWDDSMPRVRWRGDGTLFAISAVNPNTNIRQIRIFDKEGVLQYTSEAVVGLEHSLDWKPSGTLIASSQRLPNKHLIVFFEKNGLRHGEITLPYKPDEVVVKEVKWNIDSSILAVWCENIKEDDQLCSLQLWTSSNYNWQLKQNLNFPKNKRLLYFLWDTIKPYSLHIMQADGMYYEYQWKFVINGENATVVVIDNDNLKVTNFREAVVPPPMCTYTIKCAASVSCVMFTHLNNNMLVLLSNFTMVLFSDMPHNDNKLGISTIVTQDGLGYKDHGSKLYPNKIFKVDVSSASEDLVNLSCFSFHHWLYLNNETLISVTSSSGFCSAILVWKIHLDTVFIKSIIKMPSTVLGINILPATKDALIFSENNWSVLTEPYDQVKTWQYLHLTSATRCISYSTILVEDTIYVIGLTSFGQLYFNNQVVIKNCTSYAIHPIFLLFTTMQQQLICIPRTKKSFGLLQEKGLACAAGTERQTENGAKLITTVPTHAKVIVQMPRGNLETVQPRSLSLAIIQNLLENLKYAEAFDLMRRQRINLNIICDHDTNSFNTNIKEFIKQVYNPNWLCLFISDLIETDVTESMYSGYYNKNKDQHTINNKKTKLDHICSNMRNALMEIDQDGLLLPIITTYIKQTIPDIGAALNCIKQVKNLEVEGKQCAVSSDEAWNYLFYIVDVYELFDVALGLYDFDLVMMVAAKSQKDPKEYLPFLNDLRKLEANYQKYSIDKHLKKYESALKHISKCGEDKYEECLNFVKSHKLHAAAINFFSKTHSLYPKICENYATYLKSEGKFDEAGIMFARSKLYVEAINCYKKSGCWKNVLLLAPKLNLEQNELLMVYKELAQVLIEKKQYLDAAYIFLHYIQDIHEGIACYCMARAWDDAIRFAEANNLKNILEISIKSAVMEHYDAVMLQIKNWREQLEQQTKRLQIVRINKAKRLEEEGEEVFDTNECDMFSDTSSILGSSTHSRTSSRSSSKSYKSSKNKRKHERKLLSLKEGNPYEDLALVRALYELYTRVHQLIDEIRTLLMGLLYYDMDIKAKDIQNNLSLLLTDMDNLQNDIWILELAQNRAIALKECDIQANVGQPIVNILNAAAELESHLCLPPPKPKSSWKLEFLC